MRPVVTVTVNGAPVAAPFYSRLVSLEVTDQEGHRADTCRIVLDDTGGTLAIPDRGADLAVSIGYAPAGGVFVGRYVLDEVTLRAFPHAMELSGKAADMREAMKENKSRHWDDATLGEVVEEIAGDHGLAPQVAGAIASREYEYLAQQDESDLHFLERIARRHDALFAVKNGRLIFAKRGAGATAGGTALPAYVVTPDRIVEGSTRIRLADRSRYRRVVATWQDRGKQRRKEVEIESDPEGEATFRIGEPLASEAEAREAAGAKAKQLRRGIDRLSVTVTGDPGAMAGQPVTLAGVRAGIDGRIFIAKTVRHRYDKDAGFLTSIEAQSQA